MSAADYALDDRALLAGCAVSAFRASGPGGQHLQRTESAVRIVHRASGIEAVCQDHRERGRNQADALTRLRLRLAIAQRGTPDPAAIAPWRRGSRLQLGASANGYPIAVAVALDALDAAAGSLPAAGAALGVSSTQLVKLLTADKEVRQAADRLRARHGCSVLRS